MTEQPYEIVPDRAADDMDTGWGDWREGADDDRDGQLREDRPPHHDDRSRD